MRNSTSIKGEKEYSATMDLVTRVITIGILSLFLFIILSQVVIIKDGDKAIALYTSLTCFLIFLLAFAFRPVSYKLTDREIIIKRLIKDTRIDRTIIRSANSIDRKDIGFLIRSFGVGGLFGYFGSFYSNKLGQLTFYATRRDNMVLIKTTAKNYILTPDDTEAFIADLNDSSAGDFSRE